MPGIIPFHLSVSSAGTRASATAASPRKRGKTTSEVRLIMLMELSRMRSFSSCILAMAGKVTALRGPDTMLPGVDAKASALP